MSFLADLLVSTRARVDAAKINVTEEVLEQRVVAAEEPRGFAAALRRSEPTLIAEIKRATPAGGELDLDLEARRTAVAYAAGGAVAISVLTEPDSFKGSLDDLAAARAAGLPVLRKDFIIDPFQIFEARAFGADAVLLIMRILGDEAEELLRICGALGMDALVEVFDEDDLTRALAIGARVVGINHRDLETFEVDRERTAALSPSIPGEVTVVSLSGVSTRREVEELGAAGAHAILVGESIITAPDPAAKIRELLGR
ncbi:MAG: indole-3-glycerol phosphate synthase TrpC [Actinomycetota bacterium]